MDHILEPKQQYSACIEFHMDLLFLWVNSLESLIKQFISQLAFEIGNRPDSELKLCVRCQVWWKLGMNSRGESGYNYIWFNFEDCHGTSSGKCCGGTSVVSETVFLWLKQCAGLCSQCYRHFKGRER